MDYEIVAGVGPNRVLVVGAGKSGLAVARFCARRNAQVTITDKRGEAELKTAMADSQLRGVSWALGGHPRELFTDADLIVVSPGVPKLPELEAARAKGVHIVGEIELASRFIQAPIVAVTGTNGKSTVTALAGEIAQKTGRPTFVGGNLGTPMIEAVDTPAALPKGIVVVELSSFQLETTEALHPKAACLLNLTPDHLDRYRDVDEYGRAKLRIAHKMTFGDVLVVNAADAWLTAHVKPFAERVPTLYYAAQARAPGLMSFLDGDALVLTLEGGEERYPIADLNLIGRHNLGNALAAITMMRMSDLATPAQVRAGLKSFLPLPHRMQLVGDKRGVRYYDDSKATNVDSVVAGIDGFPRPFLLIAGGRDKGGSYAPMVEALRRNPCRGVILIGEAAEKIDAALDGQVASERAPSLEQAVARAAAKAQHGDAVVLSPACSSYDMFQNYEHRGRAFRAAVEALPHE
jgi:UDP-N-acetylmuramoylalanine--D-glutamate ligase